MVLLLIHIEMQLKALSWGPDSSSNELLFPWVPKFSKVRENETMCCETILPQRFQI